MKLFSLIFTILALCIILFNFTKLNFDAFLKGESYIAVITIVIALCAIVLVHILRISKKIERLHKHR